MEMDEELLAEFLTESNENMASIEEQLMELEANPGDEELVNGIFRVIHTVKGSCGFLGLKGLEKTAHAGENLLGKIRALKFQVNDDMVSLLLACADGINEYLQGLEQDGIEPVLDHGSVISRLQAAERLVEVMVGSDPTASSAPAAVAKTVAKTPVEEAAPIENTTDANEQITVEDWAGDFDEPVRAALTARGWHTPEQVMEAGFAPLRALQDISPADALKILGLAKKLVAKGGASKKKEVPASKAEAAPVAPEAEAVDATVEAEKQATGKKKASGQKDVASVNVAKAAPAQSMAVAKAQKPKSAGSIRVDVSLLDALMNQVGELVLTRNRLLQMVNESGSMEFMRVGREIDQVTERLQSQLLQTRMQPIKTIWSSVPRVVREISKSLNKRIQVVMEGEETELDRSILNALKDPLTHIIRNSCDHGVEMPDIRRASGKSEEGVLKLVAAQESGHIVITISDDGGGIDAARVKAKAVSMGVITQDVADAMPDQAALQLIFNAGLSTVEKVSNLSGRGVGMDVVKTSIEKVGGSIDIASGIGQGTVLRIRIPLTLAIISAMIVRCMDRRYAIPQISIRELLSAPASSDDWRTIGGHPFFRLRGRLLPVLELGLTLKLADEVAHQGSIVVIDIGDRTFGILIDEIFGAEEIVVKPLGVHFQHLTHYGGCSILGDGSVIPILDCNGLAQMMELSEEADHAANMMADDEDVSINDLQHVLVFRQDGSRYAIPMALVERLEKFPAENIETSGSKEVLQYRNKEVIPVLRWGELAGLASVASEQVYGLILSDGHHRMCLQVDEIVDILEIPLEIKKASQDEFFLGTTIILEQATEVVDVFDVIKRAVPDWFSQSVDASGESARRSILFVEDAPFFRNLVVPVLQAMNYEIWTASDGEEACRILADKTPDLILTDIEMPNMDGYELADWIASQPHLKGVPVMALTAAPPAEDDTERRRNFDDVLVKFDRHSLVEHLQSMMGGHGADKLNSVDADIVSGDVTGDVTS
ncbi:MAG: chemotaxis protein CheW [Mariprofundus sp.]|nr:chemotaxis protein CheW [Mariprofundus sp.]